MAESLPFKLFMPLSSNLTSISEIALKTIPSASKIEIKQVLESFYGLEVEKVRTLNMKGKKKKRGGWLIAKPDYKKAYVTLKSPFSLSRDSFPVGVALDEKKRISKEKMSSFVEEGKRQHWLEGQNRSEEKKKEKGLVDDVAAVKFQGVA